MSDKELIALLARSPEEGLRQVIKRYSAYVYKIALSKLSSHCPKEDIEEAVSDIFLKFFYFAKGEGSSLRSVAAPLCVIAKRVCADILRAKARQQETLALDEIDEPAVNDIYAEPSELLELIKRLGEPDTTIMIRRYYLGFSAKEIGSSLNMKPNTVNKRVSRAVDKLREWLKEGEK